MTPDRSSEDASPQNRQQAGTQGASAQPAGQAGTQMGGGSRGGSQQSGDMGRGAQQGGGVGAGQQGTSSGSYPGEPRGRDWRREDTYARGSDDRDRGFPMYGGGLFSSMRRLSDEMDRMFDSFLGGRSRWGSGSSYGDDEGRLGRGTASQGSSTMPTDAQRRASSGAVTQPGSQSASPTPSFWSPHIEMYERDGKLVITADLPGLKRDDVNIELHPDHIVLQGSRQQEQTTNERGYYRSERSYGSFYRSIPLPEGVDGDSARATFEDGVLRIEMKAPERRQPRRLQIDGDSGGTGGAGGSGGAGGAGQASGG